MRSITQQCSRSEEFDGDDISDTLHIRRREKFVNLSRPSSPESKFKVPITKLEATLSHSGVPSQTSVELDRAVSSTNISNPDTSATVPFSPLTIKSHLNIFPQGLVRRVNRVALPKIGNRIDTTPQLAMCCSLLPGRDGSGNVLQQHDLDEPGREWVKHIEQNPFEQKQVRWLANQMVEEFAMDAAKNSAAISEIVVLGPVLDREHYRKLLSCFLIEFGQAQTLDVDLLQGVVQLVQCASPRCLLAVDLVTILSTLRTRLEGTHHQNTVHPCHLTLAVSRILDIMAEHEVKDLDRVLEHEPLSAVLSGLKGSSDSYLLYQASYAFQALQYIPDGETALQAVLRHSNGDAESLVKISGVIQLDFGGFLHGLKSMQKALEENFGVAKAGYEGVCSLVESGQGVLESLKEGLRSGQKRLWYPAVRAAHNFVRTDQLSDMGRLIYEAPCRRDPLFQWGICQLLGEIATDPVWKDETRQQVIELPGNLYKNDADWAKDESIKAWMAIITAQLGGMSVGPIQASSHALLQDFDLDQGVLVQHPYPLMARLSTPVSFPLFAKVQETAAVEYGLHQLRLQRLEEGRQPIYIAPQAKANLNAKDDDLFSLMGNVKEFLESRRQVMLILGDSGSGKSTFNRHLEHDLWSHYEKGGPIPLFINLPSIDRPDLDMVDNQLKHYNFREAQIQELKQHREFILICDGYDENRQMANLHRTNNLNQSGQWCTKTVISCRTQYLGPSYLHRFKPQPNDRYSSVSPDLLQEAVIAPFSINQIENYVKQHIQGPTTQVIFGKQRIWSAKEYMGKLGAIPNLMDLIKNPFLLSLSLKAIPGVM